MQIEIKKGHDTSSYFWIMPAKVRLSDKIIEDDVELRYDYEISVEEGDVECFLQYFFYKYFDMSLPCNKYRHDECMYISERFGKVEFEWWLEHNFYTYIQAERMCAEIEWAADTLEKDFGNIYLEPIMKNFSIFYMTDKDNPDHIAGVTNLETIKRNIDCVVDFYRRFTGYLRKMMKENPDFDYISIMGP